MYIDWVITLSLIILVLTCVFLGYGLLSEIKTALRMSFGTNEHWEDGYLKHAVNTSMYARRRHPCLRRF